MIRVSSLITYADYMNALSSGAEYHVQIIPYGISGVSPLTEEDIESSGFQISDILNADERLVPGRAVMKELSINFLPTTKVQSFDWNAEFTLRVMLKVGTRWEATTLGMFRGTRPEKVHNTDVVHFKAYDRMQNFDVPAEPFMQSLVWPLTLEDFTEKLCEYCGVSYVYSSDTLQNVWGRSFSSGFNAAGLTCRDLLALVAEACGCYAVINNTGSMTLKWFSEVDPEDYAVIADREFTVDAMDVPAATTWAQMAELTWEEASHRTWGSFAGWQTLFAYDGLNVRQTEDDVGVSYGGLTGNVLTIVDNPFLAIREDGDGEAYVKPLWERLQAFGGHLPMSVECSGNWLVEAGDIVQVDVSGETIMMPIFNRTMRFNGACTDRYEITGTLEKQAYSSNGAREKLTRGAKFHEFRVDIDKLVSRIGDAEGNISTLEQTAEDIELEVRDKYDRVSGILIEAEGIRISGSKFIELAAQGYIQLGSGWKIVEGGLQYTDANGKILNIGNKLHYSSGDVMAQISPSADDNGNGQLIFSVSLFENGTFVSNKEVVLSVDPDTGVTAFHPQGASASRLGLENNQWEMAHIGEVYAHSYVNGDETRGDLRLRPNGTAGVGRVLLLSEATDTSDGITYLDMTEIGGLLRGIFKKVIADAISAGTVTGTNLTASNELSAGKITLTGREIVSTDSGKFLVFRPNGANGYYVFFQEYTEDSVKYILIGGNGDSSNQKLYVMASKVSAENVAGTNVSAGKITLTGREIVCTDSGQYIVLRPNGASGYYLYTQEMTEDGVKYILLAGSDGAGSDNWKLRINAARVVATVLSGTTVQANKLQYYSSREVKHDIQPLEDMGAKIDRLAPVSFIYNNDEEGRKRFGLIQEDTAKVMPEICSGDENSKPEERAINYVDLVPVLLKEIQELRKRVSGLESRVAELERR